MYFSNSLRDRKRRKLIISWIFFQPDGMAVGMGEQTPAGPRAPPPQDGTLGCREDALLAFGATGEPVLPVLRAGVRHGLARPCCHRAVSQVWLCQGHVHNGAAPGESVPQEGPWNAAGWETGPSLSSLSRRSRQGVRVMRREEAQRRPRWDAQEKGQAWGIHNPKLRLKTQNEIVSLCDTVAAPDT